MQSIFAHAAHTEDADDLVAETRSRSWRYRYFVGTLAFNSSTVVNLCLGKHVVGVLGEPKRAHWTATHASAC